MDKTYEYGIDWECIDREFLTDKGFDKLAIKRFLKKTMLNKTQAMFKWEGLPDEIPSRDLELRIQSKGFTIIGKNEEKLYSLNGNLGGRYNFNYMPSLAIVANPYLRIVSKQYKINYGYELPDVGYTDYNDLDECVIIPNDPLYMGLSPIMEYYYSRMVETHITRILVSVRARAMNVFKATDDTTAQSIDKMIENLFIGKMSSITSKNMLKEEDVSSLPFGDIASGRMITELIESEQYDKASLWNELGLQANYNMKRESITSNESQLNQDAIIPLADSMLETRKKACELVNSTFGTNWSVDFSSSWKYKREEIEIELEKIRNEAEKPNEVYPDTPNEEKSTHVDNEENKEEDKENETDNSNENRKV